MAFLVDLAKALPSSGNLFFGQVATLVVQVAWPAAPSPALTGPAIVDGFRSTVDVSLALEKDEVTTVGTLELDFHSAISPARGLIV